MAMENESALGITLPKNAKTKSVYTAIKQYRKLKAQIDALNAQLADAQAIIKAAIEESGTTELRGVDWKAKLTTYPQTRLDTKLLKANLPKVYEQYSKQTMCQRLTIS